MFYYKYYKKKNLYYNYLKIILLLYFFCYIYIYTYTFVMGRKKIKFEKPCATCGNIFEPGKHKEKLNCSNSCLSIYKEKHKDERMKNTFKGIKKKYGVEHPSQIKDFAKKVKQTKKENYGDENYNNRDSAKKTCKEKYGTEHHLQNEEILNKQFKTNKEKYGVKYQLLTDKCIEGAKQKNIENTAIANYNKAGELSKTSTIKPQTASLA